MARTSVDEFRITVAETYDIIVEPQEDRAYTLFAESMDRSGYARGTLAPRQGMTAPIPRAPRPPASNHGGHGHGGHA
jgi:FtsP/CotA-like multicopper oxidase with cupredoxin domain